MYALSIEIISKNGVQSMGIETTIMSFKFKVLIYVHLPTSNFFKSDPSASKTYKLLADLTSRCSIMECAIINSRI